MLGVIGVAVAGVAGMLLWGATAADQRIDQASATDSRPDPGMSSSDAGRPNAGPNAGAFRISPAPASKTSPLARGNDAGLAPTTSGGPGAAQTATTLPADPAPTPAVAASVPVADPSSAAGATTAPAVAAPPTKPAPLTIIVKKDAVIGIRLDQAINSGTARVDAKVTARVSRDVIVDGVTAIPAGTRLEGVITLVDPISRGGHGKLGIRFNTLVRADDTRVAIQTDTIFREGGLVGSSSPSLNVGSGFVAVVSNRSQPPARTPVNGRSAPEAVSYRDAQLPSGSLLTVQLTAPLSMQIER